MKIGCNHAEYAEHSAKRAAATVASKAGVNEHHEPLCWLVVGQHRPWQPFTMNGWHQDTWMCQTNWPYDAYCFIPLTFCWSLYPFLELS